MGKDLKGRELGVYLSQRKDGRYQARFTNRYGERVETKSKNLKEVKQWLREEKAKDDLKINSKNCTDTFEIWYYRWKSMAFVDLALNSQEQYELIYNNCIAPSLKNIKVTDMAEFTLESFFQDLKKKYSDKTIDNAKNIIYQVLQKCKEAHCIPYNPMTEIKVKKKKQTLFSEEVLALTIKQQQMLFNYLNGHFYYNLYVFLLTTGLRYGEVAALTIDDFDMKSKTVQITKSLKKNKIDGKYQYYIGDTKTPASVRKIPLNDIACEAFQQQIILKNRVEKSIYADRHVAREFKNLLFTTPYNTPMPNQTLNSVLASAREQINFQLDEKDYLLPVSVHRLRHTFATRCFEAGIPMVVISRYLGHANVTITEQIYVHLLQDHIESQNDKLNAAYPKQHITREQILLDMN